MKTPEQQIEELKRELVCANTYLSQMRARASKYQDSLLKIKRVIEFGSEAKALGKGFEVSSDFIIEQIGLIADEALPRE